MPANSFWKYQLRKQPFNSHFTRKYEKIHMDYKSMAVGSGGKTVSKKVIAQMVGGGQVGRSPLATSKQNPSRRRNFSIKQDLLSYLYM